MNNLFVSVSGGESSGQMAKIIQDRYSALFNVVYGFANTGQETDATLTFVDKLDREFGLNLIWLEAKVNPEPLRGTRHQIVSYKTANRDGQVFESFIAKYGIPNTSYPSCTRELKLAPITSYLRSIGWKSGDYTTAIGIRADEFDRMDEYRIEKKFWYPLVERGITKAHVKDFWKSQSFTLGLLEHQGNCKWCWKKSDRKLLTLANESPEIFDFPLRMEAKYGQVRAPHGTRMFFRRDRSAKDLLSEASKPFMPFKENLPPMQSELDISNGCSESCEAFT